MAKSHNGNGEKPIKYECMYIYSLTFDILAQILTVLSLIFRIVSNFVMVATKDTAVPQSNVNLAL